MTDCNRCMRFRKTSIRLQSLHWRTVATRRLSCSALDLSVVILSWVIAAQLLQLGVDTVVPSNDVRVFGVTLSSDLTMDKLVSNVCSAGFIGCGNSDVCGGHWTRNQRLHSSTPSLFPTSIKRILAGAPRAMTDRLQRLLNAAARLVSDTNKFDQGLTQPTHVDLHWLDVPGRVKYKLVYGA